MAFHVERGQAAYHTGSRHGCVTAVRQAEPLEFRQHVMTPQAADRAIKRESLERRELRQHLFRVRCVLQVVHRPIQLSQADEFREWPPVVASNPHATQHELVQLGAVDKPIQVLDVAAFQADGT